MSIKNSPEKQHMKTRLRQTEEKIWDMHFQRDRMQHIREGIRQQYDKVNEKKVLNDKKLEEEKNKGSKGDSGMIKQLENNIKAIDPDLEQLTKQLSDFDKVLSAEDNPESIQNQVDLLEDAKRMLIQYIKKL